MPIVHVLTPGPLRYIADRMREADRIEFSACRDTFDPQEIAVGIGLRTTMGYIVHADDGEPVAAIGVCRLWQGTFALWAFGTDRWPEVVLTLTKHALRVMLPELLKQGFTYGEARALASRDDVAKWLKILGLKPLCRLPGFGTGSEDFTLYAWTADASSTP